MQKKPSNTKHSQWFAILILILGIGLRIVVYFQNRSLFLDEANLARNIFEKGFLEFFSNLDHDQYAPPLFLCLEKISWFVFGSNELSLRLFPLLGGILALYLFYRLNSILQWHWAIYAFLIFLFGFSTYFIRYATEVKQYSTDIFLCLGLIFIALQPKAQVFNVKRLFQWGIIGAISIWFSMPIVFTLSAIGIFLWIKYVEQVGTKKAFYVLLPIGLWLLSFGIYFLTILSNDLSRTVLVDYHSTYFLPLLPTNFAALSKAGNLILSIFHTAFGFTVIVYIISISFTLLGVYQLWRKNKAVLVLLLLPIMSCLIASGFGFYSLIPRMILFFIPLLFLLMGAGLQALFNWKNKFGRILVFVLMLPFIPVKKGLTLFYQAYEISEIRPILTYLNKNQKEDEQVFVENEAVPAVIFYTQMHDKKTQYQLKNIKLADWQDQPNFNESGAEIWLVFSHLISEHSLQKRTVAKAHLLKNGGREIQTFIQKGASCHLFSNK